MNDLPRNPAGVIAGQKSHGVGDVLHAGVVGLAPADDPGAEAAEHLGDPVAVADVIGIGHHVFAGDDAGAEEPFRIALATQRATGLDVGLPDLLLVDWMLPDMSGLELTRVLKKDDMTREVPVIMLTAPIPATFKALDKAGLTIDDIDVFEVNEAFATVIGAWLRETGADWEKTNVNGGAIALGHPLGATGAKLMVSLLHELERSGGRYGLLAICEGMGMANATIIERL